MYGCETLSNLRRNAGCLLRREAYGPERDGLTGEWRKVHNEELFELYCSTHIIWVIGSKKNEMVGACSTYGGQESCIKGLGGET